jgi:uncharacterized membrane protein SirB2
MYMMAKHIHLTAVALSILLFVFRFILIQVGSDVANKKVFKIVPHIAYTVLVLSAAWLCVILSQYPFQTAWVTYKLVGLIAFVLMALWATNWARTKMFEWVGFLGALAWLVLTAYVAVTKQPLF